MIHWIVTYRVATSGGMISQGHKLTSTGILYYQVQSLLCLYYLEELDWRWRERGKDNGLKGKGKVKRVEMGQQETGKGGAVETKFRNKRPG